MVPIPSPILEFNEKSLAVEHTFHHVMLPDRLNFGIAPYGKKSIFHLSPTEPATPTTFSLKKVVQVGYSPFIALEIIWAQVTATLVGISNSVIW